MLICRLYLVPTYHSTRIDMYETELEFREYLPESDGIKLRHEEQAIEKAQRDLFHKYNEMIADRMSRNVLLDELKRIFEYWGPELSEVFYSLDNKTLQLIVSINSMARKEKERVMKEREDKKKEMDKLTPEEWLENLEKKVRP
jgi:hypothetical protein